MILYHGSNTPVEQISLDKCRPYKDFGKGFYLADIKRQAERMAMRTVRMFGGTPCVTKFEFDLDMAIAAGLDIRIFDGPDREWALFVMANRDINVAQPCHSHDIVIGPVADDTITRLLRMFTENYINEEQLIRELTYSEITSQFFFHTETAVKLLRKL